MTFTHFQYLGAWSFSIDRKYLRHTANNRKLSFRLVQCNETI